MCFVYFKGEGKYNFPSCTVEQQYEYHQPVRMCSNALGFGSWTDSLLLQPGLQTIAYVNIRKTRDALRPLFPWFLLPSCGPCKATRPTTLRQHLNDTMREIDGYETLINPMSAEHGPGIIFVNDTSTRPVDVTQ